jgi:hypothetical protein
MNKLVKKLISWSLKSTFVNDYYNVTVLQITEKYKIQCVGELFFYGPFFTKNSKVSFAGI